MQIKNQMLVIPIHVEIKEFALLRGRIQTSICVDVYQDSLEANAEMVINTITMHAVHEWH